MDIRQQGVEAGRVGGKVKLLRAALSVLFHIWVGMWMLAIIFLTVLGMDWFIERVPADLPQWHYIIISTGLLIWSMGNLIGVPLFYLMWGTGTLAKVRAWYAVKDKQAVEKAL